jgi:hypothetical protein
MAMNPTSLVRLIFDGGFTDLDAYEAHSRGYRSQVWAELNDGLFYPVTFFEPTRLAQELAEEASRGRQFFTEPGLIIVQEVTLSTMEAAARALAAEGFFSECAGSPVCPAST